jgi:hypothetical protein
MQIDAALLANQAAKPAEPPLKETFRQFVGETFFSQLMTAMRKTTQPPAYFHGGRAEEIFQGQLDQAIVEHVTEASADTFADPLFELFTHMRRP